MGGAAATTTTKKTRFLRKTLVVALFASIQWNAIAFIQQHSSSLSFVPHYNSRVLNKSLTTNNKHNSAPLLSWLAVVDAQKQWPHDASPRLSVLLRMAPADGGGVGGDDKSASVLVLPRAVRNPFPWTSVVEPSTLVSAETNDVIQSSLIQSTLSSSTGSNGVSSTSLPPGLMALQTLVQPVQDKLDDASADWVLSYADLRPDDSSTVPGQAFLATNALYMIAGLMLTVQGDVWFGTMTEICSVASYVYHYTQLEARGETKAPTVRLAVLVDYICAFISLGTATAYLVPMMFNDASVDMFVAAALSVAFLGLSWVYESGRPYMFFHSLWHIFGAYAGFLIGSAHNHVPLPTLATFF